MRILRSSILLLFLGCGLSSFHPDHMPLSERLIGKWRMMEMNAYRSVYRREAYFYSTMMQFKKNDRLLVDFSDICFPPRGRKKHKGTWSVSNDSILIIHYKAQLEVNDTSRVLQVDDSTLILERINRK